MTMAGLLGRDGQRRDRLYPDLQLWLNTSEVWSTTLRDFALDGTDHATIAPRPA